MISREQVFMWLGRQKKTYQPVEGYEYKISPERVRGFEKIRDTIVEHIGGMKGKRVLDIGSNFGYFCLELAKLGATTVGFERDEKRCAVAKYLAYDLGLSAGFKQGDAVEMVLKHKMKFDYVILLNVFHHLLIQNEEDAWRMFNKLIDNTNGVFVMMRNQYKEWKLCDTRLGIADAVIELSHAREYVKYPPVHGRDIYFFTHEITPTPSDVMI